MTYLKDGFHFIANAADDHIQKFCKSNGFRTCLQLIIKYPIMTSIINLSSTLLPMHGGNSSDISGAGWIVQYHLLWLKMAQLSPWFSVFCTSAIDFSEGTTTPIIILPCIGWCIVVTKQHSPSIKERLHLPWTSDKNTAHAHTNWRSSLDAKF